MKKTIGLARKTVQILGIDVDSTEVDRVLTAVEEKVSYNSLELNSSRKFYIVTPNPELILMAQEDRELKKALNSTEFSIPDGIGLSQAARFLSLPAPKNIIARFFVTLVQGAVVGLATFFNRSWLMQEIKPLKGRLLFVELMKLANKRGWKVFFLGGESNEAIVAASKISLKYRNIKIKAEPGPMFNNDGEPRSERDRELYSDVVKKINNFNPHLLIVCLQDPKEEKFVYKNHKKLNIGGAAAFGGTFRYIAGLSKLPPEWMGELGLEWVWRLIKEPFRLKRILNAFPIFPIRVWKHKLFNS